MSCKVANILNVLHFCALLQCVVGGCNASFASQGGLARHVPSHFSQQSSSKMSSQAKLKEESPSKAGLNKRKKLKNKRRCSLRTYLTDTQINPISNCFSLWFPSFSLWVRITSSTHSLLCWNRFYFQLLTSHNSHIFVREARAWPHTNLYTHLWQLDRLILPMAKFCISENNFFCLFA